MKLLNCRLKNSHIFSMVTLEYMRYENPTKKIQVNKLKKKTTIWKLYTSINLAGKKKYYFQGGMSVRLINSTSTSNSKTPNDNRILFFSSVKV